MTDEFRWEQDADDSYAYEHGTSHSSKVASFQGANGRAGSVVHSPHSQMRVHAVAYIKGLVSRIWVLATPPRGLRIRKTKKQSTVNGFQPGK